LAGWSTSIFLIGWASGGLIFGVFGDRLGRVRTLTLTILLYSLFTGLSALSVSVWDFCAYRFLTGLGVGGVFAAAVALVAETMPTRARPQSLALMQALSGVGNCAAAALYSSFGLVKLNGHLTGFTTWRIMFLIGIVPAAIVIFIQRRLKEPSSWLQARDAAAAGVAKKLGSYGELFGEDGLRSRAIFGMLLCFAGVVGLWGIVFFSIDLQQVIFRSVFAKEAAALNLTGDAAKHYMDGQRLIWAGITSFMLNVGAFFGIYSFSWVAERIGRRPTFALAFFAAGISTACLFLFMTKRVHILLMTPVMGFCVLALFGGYAVYLPELFPTRLRATGTSFCYNVGRFIAAIGPLIFGILTTDVFTADKGYQDPLRDAGLVMCAIFILGLAVLPFLPETNGRPLPE